MSYLLEQRLRDMEARITQLEGLGGPAEDQGPTVGRVIEELQYEITQLQEQITAFTKALKFKVDKRTIGRGK